AVTESADVPASLIRLGFANGPPEILGAAFTPGGCQGSLVEGRPYASNSERPAEPPVADVTVNRTHVTVRAAKETVRPVPRDGSPPRVMLAQFLTEKVPPVTFSVVRVRSCRTTDVSVVAVGQVNCTQAPAS